MKHRALPVLWEAAKVAVVVWVVLAIEPAVADIFPKLDVGWRYLISATATALVLEIVLQVFLGWPRIVVQWSVKAEPTPISSIVARVNKRNRNSQVFVVRVSTPPSGWLGYLILKGWMRLGVTLQIRIDRAAAAPTVDGASRENGIPSIRPDDASRGVVVDLGRPPRRPGEWHWADVRWKAEGEPDGVELNVDYVLHHPNSFLRLLLRIFVWRTTNVRHFQLVGT